MKSKHKEEAAAVMRLALDDFTACKGMADDEDRFSDRVFGFHAQQCIENALKAWIASFGRRYPLTHNLGSLMHLLVELGEDVAQFETLAEFEPYAAILRYTSPGVEGDAPDRAYTVRKLQKLIEHVCLRLESTDRESRPE